MKLAYLILVHEQPNHFSRLVKALDDEGVNFYIHLDSKKNEFEYNNFEKMDNMTFLSDRIGVNRSGFSLTMAMVKLIEEASKKDYDYYIFLSGRDYPIKDNNYIRNFFEEHQGMNFINFYPLVGEADWVENIKTYDFVDALAWVPRYFRKPVNALRYVIRKLLPRRKFLSGITPYRGSQFWCLNRETISYVMEFLDSPESDRFKKYFKYVHNSDEIFFQTIVLNSPFASQCRYYERDIINLVAPMKNENKAYLHYIDWDRARENPAVFVEQDFTRLKETDKLFARKFDEIKSKAFLAKIDSELLHLKTNHVK